MHVITAWSRRLQQRNFAAISVLFIVPFLARVSYFTVMVPYYPQWSPREITRNHWVEIAQHLERGDGIVLDLLLTWIPVPEPKPTATRGPVPLFILASVIRIFGDTYYPMLGLAYAMSALTCVLLYIIALRCTGSSTTALGAWLLYALFLPEMRLTTAFSTCAEPPFMLLLAIYFWLGLRCADEGKWHQAALGGLALGLACLCRPVVLFLPVLYVLWLFAWQRQRGLGLACVFLAVFTAVQIPWVVRNYRVFGVPVVTSTLGGLNLYRYNVMIANNQYTYSIPRKYFYPMLQQIVRESGIPLAELNEVQFDDLLKAKAVEIIRAHPLRYARLCGLRLLWIWYKMDSGRGLYLVQNLLYYFLAIIGAVVMCRTRNLLLGVLMVHLLYFVAVHVGINTQYRFIAPMLPYVVILSMIGLEQLSVAAGEKPRRLIRWALPGTASAQPVE